MNEADAVKLWSRLNLGLFSAWENVLDPTEELDMFEAITGPMARLSQLAPFSERQHRSNHTCNV